MPTTSTPRRPRLSSLLSTLLCGCVLVAAADRAAAQDPLADDSPVITEPKTPEEFFDAAVLMDRIARPNLARLYLQRYLESNPSTDDLLKLYDEQGPAVFIRLKNNPTIAPVSKPLYERIRDALKARNADPARINKLIDDLSSANRADQEVAVVTLRNLGEDAAPALIRRLASPKDSVEQGNLVNALTRMTRSYVPPILGALTAESDELKIGLLIALAELGRSVDLDRLWGLAFSPDESIGVQTAAKNAIAKIIGVQPASVDEISDIRIVGHLRTKALEHFEGVSEFETDPAGNVTLWAWRPQLETVEKVAVDPATARSYFGSRLARRAVEVAPDNTELQALYLAMALSSEAQAAGWENKPPTGPGTAHDLALTSGPDVLTRALSESIERGNAAAATATLQALGRVGSPELLKGTEGEPAPLVRALNAPDPRVQFAAATAILELGPPADFRESDRVRDVLARALRSDFESKALVVHPNATEARTYASYMGNLGYNAIIANTGKEAFRTAASRSDIDLVVLSAGMVQWPLSQTVANLRADARTKGMPILIFGPPTARENVQGLIVREPNVGFTVESVTPDLFVAQARPFVSSIRTPPLTAEQQARNAKLAAYWLGYLGQSGRAEQYQLAEAEDALFTSVDDPELVNNALIALGRVPTNSAQKRLHEIVTSPGRPVGVREQAAIQLADHIGSFGLLLSSGQADALTNAYRNAETPQLSSALAAVLGSLKPDATLTAERLKSYPRPTLAVPTP